MEAVDVEGVLKVVEFSLSQLKWKLRSSSKHRLETDILALVTEMRPVIMVDYGGKMPELQERLCSLIKHCKKESSVFEYLKVMVMEDMIYLIHTRSLAKFVNSCVDLQKQVLFIDLEQDPPKIVAQSDKCSAVSQLLSIQKQFSTLFRMDGILQSEETNVLDDATATSSATESGISASSELIDLSSWIQETEITLPSLNGWLLGYPVVYLFRKEHIQDAVYNLSTKSLHLFHLFVTRNGTSNRVQPQKEELMSFSIPYELSLEGGDEEWAKAFVADMRLKLEGCKHVWGSMKMEVQSCYPQAIAL